MNWSFSRKAGSAPRFLSFESSQQDNLLPSIAFTSKSIVDDQNRRTQYSSLQEGRMFPICSHQDQTTITTSMSKPGLQFQYSPGRKSFTNSFINHQASPLDSVFPAPSSVLGPTDTRSSSKQIGSPPGQLTIFYAGSVSVYQDISPEKAEAIMLLARDAPQAKLVPMSKAQKPVHHSLATIDSPTIHPRFGATKKMPTVVSTPRNNQTEASIMVPSVGLPQSRKASLNRFLEKRKERVINVSPYCVDNKSPSDRQTPMSESVNSSQIIICNETK